MLYKNEVIYELSRFPKEIEAVEKHFHGKFPVKVVYPPDRIMPSKLKHNRRPDKPNSISFDLKATVKTPVGTEVWRYAENIIIGEQGKKRYIPKKFLFDGTKFLDRNDIELIYFLLRKSEYCLGGDNQGKMTKFMFEDLITEADKKAEKKKIETKINILLYGDDLALSEERLRQVAMAYGIKNVDTFTFSQVKILISNKINESKTGADRFFDMVNADEEIAARVSIQRAIDMDVLKYDKNKATWLWKTQEGDRAVGGGKVPPDKSAFDALYTLYLGDESFREDLKAVSITKKPLSPKKGGKGHEQIDEEKDE